MYALCDINRERALEMGKKYNVERIYTDIDEMLKLDEIDAVLLLFFMTFSVVSEVLL